LVEANLDTSTVLHRPPPTSPDLLYSIPQKSRVTSNVTTTACVAVP